MRVKCLAQEHNISPRPGLEPGPLDPEAPAPPKVFSLFDVFVILLSPFTFLFAAVIDLLLGLLPVQNIECFHVTSSNS